MHSATPLTALAARQRRERQSNEVTFGLLRPLSPFITPPSPHSLGTLNPASDAARPSSTSPLPSSLLPSPSLSLPRPYPTLHTYPGNHTFLMGQNSHLIWKPTPQIQLEPTSGLFRWKGTRQRWQTTGSLHVVFPRAGGSEWARTIVGCLVFQY